MGKPCPDAADITAVTLKHSHLSETLLSSEDWGQRNVDHSVGTVLHCFLEINKWVFLLKKTNKLTFEYYFIIY